MPVNPPSLDTALLRGFRYGCLPGCGLCCFAEPRIDPSERPGLLRIAPAVDIVEAGGASYLRARPDGGACGLLEELRCSAHAVRPHPCREFPVHVHVGTRLQASLVLSCPGVYLGRLIKNTPDAERAPPVGFDSELASVERRSGPDVARRLKEAGRRRGRLVRALEREGRWVEEEEVRGLLRTHLPRPGPADYPVGDPPSADDGLEFLPIYFDGRAGPVGLGAGLGGWEALELRPSGGVERHLGVVPSPTSPPPLDPGAELFLRGYLRYFLERDLLFASVLPRMAEGGAGTVTEWVEEELREIGAIVVSRASVRAKLARGSTGPLTATDLVAGIRASDQDLMDVPTWGDRL
ncbi:MAG TPA: YkgJ family cysteine cluster protein [Thermoplasmata archaeon]|nr:YkgJ family cysteine cluster protein [Thermoplasmata archaeon]